MSNHLKLEQFQLLLDGNTSKAGKALRHLELCAPCQLELSRQAAVELELTLLQQWGEDCDSGAPIALFEGESAALVNEALPPARWSAMGGFLLMASCCFGLVTWSIGNVVGTPSALLAEGSCHQLHAWCP